MTSQGSPVTSVFDAAKAIVETLKKVDKQQQEQAIRFASESLGLSIPSHAQGSGLPRQTATGTPPHPSGAQARSTDVKQYTNTKAPRSHQQFAAVVAYFYRYEASEAQRKDFITADDLREAVRLVGWKGLTIPLSTLNNAKNAGYLDAAARGQFRISTVGENLVAVTLPGDNTEAPRRRAGGRKKVAKKQGRARKRARR